MSDDASIRLENLKRLNLGPTDLRERLGSSYSLWSDLLKGRKSFGEKIARRIEDGLTLPRGWLDEAQSAIPELPALEVPKTSIDQTAAMPQIDAGPDVEPDKEAVMHDKEVVWALFSRLDPAQRARLVGEMFALGQAQVEAAPGKNVMRRA